MLPIEEQAKKEIIEVWRTAKPAREKILAFGKKCHEWQLKLQEKGLTITKIYKDLGVPRQTAYMAINSYLIEEGESTPKKDRSKTNSQIINAIYARVMSTQKAIGKISKDWAGWETAVPAETKRLKETIKKFSDFISKCGI